MVSHQESKEQQLIIRAAHTVGIVEAILTRTEILKMLEEARGEYIKLYSGVSGASQLAKIPEYPEPPKFPEYPEQPIHQKSPDYPKKPEYPVCPNPDEPEYDVRKKEWEAAFDAVTQLYKVQEKEWEAASESLAHDYEARMKKWHAACASIDRDFEARNKVYAEELDRYNHYLASTMHPPAESIMTKEKFLRLRKIFQEGIRVTQDAPALHLILGNEVMINQGEYCILMLDLMHSLAKKNVFIEMLFSIKVLEFILACERILNKQEDARFPYDVQVLVDEGFITVDEILSLVPLYKKCLRIVSPHEDLSALFNLAKKWQIADCEGSIIHFSSVYDVHGNVPTWLEINDFVNIELIEKQLQKKIAQLEKDLDSLQKLSQNKLWFGQKTLTKILARWGSFLATEEKQPGLLTLKLRQLLKDLQEVEKNGLHVLLKKYDTPEKLQRLVTDVNAKFAASVATNQVHTLVDPNVVKRRGKRFTDKEAEAHPVEYLITSERILIPRERTVRMQVTQPEPQSKTQPKPARKSLFAQDDLHVPLMRTRRSGYGAVSDVDMDDLGNTEYRRGGDGTQMSTPRPQSPKKSFFSKIPPAPPKDTAHTPLLGASALSYRGTSERDVDDDLGNTEYRQGETSAHVAKSTSKPKSKTFYTRVTSFISSRKENLETPLLQETKHGDISLDNLNRASRWKNRRYS